MFVFQSSIEQLDEGFRYNLISSFYHCTVIRHLTKGIRSEKCVVGRFRLGANVT